MINLNEYHVWLGDAITIAIRRILKDKVESIKSDWLDGRWANQPEREAYARGYAAGLLAMEDLDKHFEQGD